MIPSCNIGQIQSIYRYNIDGYLTQAMTLNFKNILIKN